MLIAQAQQQTQERVVHALEGLRRAQEEDKAQSKGTLAARARGLCSSTKPLAATIFGRYKVFWAMQRWYTFDAADPDIEAVALFHPLPTSNSRPSRHLVLCQAERDVRRSRLHPHRRW